MQGYEQLKLEIWDDLLESCSKKGLIRMGNNVKTFGSGIYFRHSSETAPYGDGNGFSRGRQMLKHQ
jgi:hypothetical protein